MMLRRKATIALLVAFLSAGMLRAEQSTAPNYSKAEVRKMIREAHTSEDYQVLASYFRAQQQAYREKAKSEMLELERRWQFMDGPAAKYPRPVDSSRNRYEYFMYEVGQMKQQAVHYENLAANTQ